MKITDLTVEGFGVWTGLRIERVSEGLNVLYGPNEAGKTTLLQFVRSMLYGFSAERRRYLPPVHGGRSGGVLELASPHGRFAVARYDEPSDDGALGEQVTLTAPDGTRQGEHFLKVLLSNIDEPVFNNVFAVGLREIQELATLSDTEAAELLYSLSAGLDRVSLVDVLRELENSRNRLLDPAGRPCQIVQLLTERERLQAEIEELGAVHRHYAHLAAQRDGLRREIVRFEEDVHQVERSARAIDLALSLRDRWTRRASLDDQLSALGPVRPMPDGAMGRLDALNAKLQHHQQRLDELAESREQAKREFDSLCVNEALWRQTARIEALKDQEPWIDQLRGQIAELQAEIDQCQSELTVERDRLGWKADWDSMPRFSAKTLTPLRASARRLREGRQRLNEARQAADAAGRTAQSLAEQIHSAIASRGAADLASAMDQAGSLVAQLRRRLQMDERLDQLARHQSELEQRTQGLIERQLPVRTLAALGATFSAGALLILAGLFWPTTAVWSIGWTLVILSLAGAAASLGGHWMIGRANAQQLDGCHKQLGVLQMQVQQTKSDRDALDLQLPRGGGPIPVRLETAERELAALEELSPLETRRNAAQQEFDAASHRVHQSEEELKQARRRWRESVADAGLPEDFGPKQVQCLSQRGDRIVDLQRRSSQRREELGRRQRELDALSSRVSQLAADAGVSLHAADPVEQIDELSEAVARQQSDAVRRETLRHEARRIRAARAKREEAVSRLNHLRRELFFESGVHDEQEFRQRALQCAQAEALQRDRDAVAREIEAALGSQCSENDVRRQLESPQTVPLETRREELRRRADELQRQLRESLEQRGRLTEQLDAMAADRRLAGKTLDLAVLEKRLDAAIERWRVLAATCCILDVIRTTYEQHRQPETLQEASGYLDELTQGRYHRVWTPLGRHVLMVDDAQGHALPVEVLSRGTREQLFLALRLALAGSYARRGAPLPLVLDDVLVNFDADRAKAAAVVLRDFATAGHQLLVFTCHEHILKIFQSLRTPVTRLPSNAEPGEVVITLERRNEEKPKRAREPKSPRKSAARQRVPQLDEETETVADESEEIEQDDSLWEDDADQADEGGDHA
ncbi:MAG: AAA family ATPase [Thermoguttaceae bacterium]